MLLFWVEIRRNLLITNPQSNNCSKMVHNKKRNKHLATAKKIESESIAKKNIEVEKTEKTKKTVRENV